MTAKESTSVFLIAGKVFAERAGNGIVHLII
jgi:hypothetical protein